MPGLFCQAYLVFYALAHKPAGDADKGINAFKDSLLTMYSLGILGLALSLIVDTAFSWARMFAALAFSVVISLLVGIYAATHKTAEKIIIPLVDILQTLPILAFFPFAILIIVSAIPGALGINAAVVFLIITSMVWNIIFGVYESVKSLPKEYMELSRLYGLSRWDRLTKIQIPAAMPRVVEQSILSWSIGLFYLVTSEIFSTANAAYAVKTGIGAAIASPAITGNIISYSMAIGIFIIFVIATRFLFFKPWEDYVTRYTRNSGKKQSERQWPLNPGQIGTMGARFIRKIEKGNISRIVKVLPGMQNRQTAALTPNRPSRHETYWKFAPYIILFLAAALTLYTAVSNHALVLAEETVLTSLSFSFARIWLAFAISMCIGVPICVYTIFLTRHGSKYTLLFQIISSIPATILLPAIVSLLRSTPHSGELVASIVFVLSSIWYIIFSTLNTAKTMPQNIFEVKDIFRVKGWKAWKNIYLKAIIPGLVTGSVTAIAAEWNASIIAEYFTVGASVVSQVGTGIGKLLDLTLASNNLGLMMLALINLTVIIILINTFVWKRLYSKVSRAYA